MGTRSSIAQTDCLKYQYTVYLKYKNNIYMLKCKYAHLKKSLQLYLGIKTIKVTYKYQGVLS